MNDSTQFCHKDNGDNYIETFENCQEIIRNNRKPAKTSDASHQINIVNIFNTARIMESSLFLTEICSLLWLGA